MNALRFLVAGMMLSLLTVGVSADDKKEKTDNAKLLVGKWEVTKADKELPVGATIEFTKDGKMTIIVGKEKQIDATYRVDGDKIPFNLIAEGKEDKKDPITIKKLSEKELIIEGRNSVIFEFKRVK
jgi:uncharacterized protein (TIGR03066 family)